MYNDHKTKYDRINRLRPRRTRWEMSERTQIILSMIVLAVLFALASNADWQALQAGI